jgi:hypothetical protein
MLISYIYMYFCTCRVMSAPPRKSRRIAARRPPQTNASINPNIPVHTTDHVQTTDTNANSTSELINSQINAAIPDITNSVIAALSAHGLIFPGNSQHRLTLINLHVVPVQQ